VAAAANFLDVLAVIAFPVCESEETLIVTVPKNQCKAQPLLLIAELRGTIRNRGWHKENINKL
jgi:hypothetical protein